RAAAAAAECGRRRGGRSPQERRPDDGHSRALAVRHPGPDARRHRGAAEQAPQDQHRGEPWLAGLHAGRAQQDAARRHLCAAARRGLRPQGAPRAAAQPLRHALGAAA
ncbi:hypothetical protein BN1708_019942, partial [Verticillium longisporum]